MGSARQIAIELKLDIAASPDVARIKLRLEGKEAKDIEEICSVLVDGTSVFHAIAAHDRDAILEFIINQGVDINSVDKTALHVAVSQKAIKTTRLLLQNGANIKVMSADGKTPLHIAAEMGNTPIVAELLAHDVEILLNRPENTGCTPLSLACLSGREDTVKLLVEKGAALNRDGSFSPVHAAAMTGNMNFLRMFEHNKGADIDWNATDRNGVTPIHYATYRNHKKAVQFLLSVKADPHIKDGRGRTASELAKTEEMRALFEGKA